MGQLPRLGKRELICLLFTYNYVVFVWRGFLFLWVLGMGYVILLWHSLSLPYNYFEALLVHLIEKLCQRAKPHKGEGDGIVWYKKILRCNQRKKKKKEEKIQIL